MTHPVEATPKTREAVSAMAGHPEVVTEARTRGIEKVVHFTTLKGAVGVLASRSLKSRALLRKEEYLEHVYEPNATFRKDTAWLSYVNLSIERINDWMFDTSVRWHAKRDNPWVVLSFTPEVLGHAGVVFGTTNNIYPSCQRAEGLPGFQQLFESTVVGRNGYRHERDATPSAWPTDRQAEVLYPYELSCKHLQRIDVQVPEAEDDIRGALAGLDLMVSVRHASEVFE